MAYARPLEPSGDDLRTLLAQATDYVTGVVERLPADPVADLGGVTELLADPKLRRLPPAEGRPFADLLGVLDRAAGKGMRPNHPGLLAYVPGSGLVVAAVADLLTDVLNRYAGRASPSPGLVAIEADVLRWLAGLTGLPEGAGGILTTGASLATFSALVAARHARLGTDFRRGSIYVSDQTHHCVAKAARLAGFPPDAVRKHRPVARPRAHRHDRTTLAARGRRVRRLLPAHRTRPAPCLLVRDTELLRAAHSGTDPHYLRDLRDPRTAELPDFSEYGPELTREVRGLRLWLPLHLHGVDAFRDALDEKLDLAEYAYQELADDPNLCVLAAPELSTVAFHSRAGDEATAELLRRVNAAGRVYLSSTNVGGRHTGGSAS